jgi:hypothetical protein
MNQGLIGKEFLFVYGLAYPPDSSTVLHNVSSIKFLSEEDVLITYNYFDTTVITHKYSLIEKDSQESYIVISGHVYNISINLPFIYLSSDLGTNLVLTSAHSLGSMEKSEFYEHLTSDYTSFADTGIGLRVFIHKDKEDGREYAMGFLLCKLPCNSETLYIDYDAVGYHKSFMLIRSRYEYTITTVSRNEILLITFTKVIDNGFEAVALFSDRSIRKVRFLQVVHDFPWIPNSSEK